MRNVSLNNVTGITVGRRKDGSVAVLWSDDTIEWYSASDAESLLSL